MPTLDFTNINWLAVVVAGMATFMLGGIWYTAVFGKTWQRLHKLTPEQVKAMQASKPPALFFGGMVICYVVCALAIAVLVTRYNVTTPLGGAGLGSVVWLVVASLLMTGHIASDKHIGIYFIDTTFHLIALLVIGAILGAWR